jgi:hypothetical protein
MSLQETKQHLIQLLGDADNKVIALSGKWATGIRALGSMKQRHWIRCFSRLCRDMSGGRDHLGGNVIFGPSTPDN